MDKKTDSKTLFGITLRPSGRRQLRERAANEEVDGTQEWKIAARSHRRTTRQVKKMRIERAREADRVKRAIDRQRALDYNSYLSEREKQEAEFLGSSRILETIQLSTSESDVIVPVGRIGIPSNMERIEYPCRDPPVPIGLSVEESELVFSYGGETYDTVSAISKSLCSEMWDNQDGKACTLRWPIEKNFERTRDKLPHEMAFQAGFGKFSDTKFLDILPEKIIDMILFHNDPSYIAEDQISVQLLHSPDFIEIVEGKILRVIELKTRRTNVNKAAGLRALSQSVGKYRRLLNFIENYTDLTVVVDYIYLFRSGSGMSVTLNSSYSMGQAGQDMANGFLFGLIAQEYCYSQKQQTLEIEIIGDSKMDEETLTGVVELPDEIDLDREGNIRHQLIISREFSDEIKGMDKETCKKTAYHLLTSAGLEEHRLIMKEMNDSDLDLDNYRANRMKKNIELLSKRRSEWAASQCSGEGESVSRKKLFSLPLCSLPERGCDKTSKLLMASYHSAGSTVEERMFSRASGEMLRREDTDRLSYDDLKTVYKERALSKRTRKKQRSQALFKRVVKIELSTEDRIYLGKRGVQGKSAEKKYSEVRSKREVQSLPVSFISDTSDINNFIQKGWSKVMRTTETICRDIASDTVEGEGAFVKSFRKSKLWNMCSGLSRICEVVNLERRENVNKDEFIVSRVPGTSCLLLIKTTKSQSHIFFSCLTGNDVSTSNNVFSETMAGQWSRTGNGYCFPFIGMSEHKIAQYIDLAESVLTLAVSVYHSRGMPIPVKEINPINMLNGESRSSFCFLLLSLLEDKEKTSNDALKLRFAYMEVAYNSVHTQTDPMKIVSKWSLLRSRLQLWVHTSAFNVFDTMIRKPPVMHSDSSEGAEKGPDESEDHYMDLVDITGETVRGFRQILMTCYSGYLHNKEEGEFLHGFKQIFSKIVKLERKLISRWIDSKPVRKGTDQRDFEEEFPAMKKVSNNFDACRGLSSHDLDDFKKEHTFSREYVCHMGDRLKDSIIKKHGNMTRWRRIVFLPRLRKKFLDEFATFRSSARGVEKGMFSKIMSEHKDASMYGRRIKCIEAVINHIKTGDLRGKNIIDCMHQIIECVKDGLESNLFKKLQFGGVREIFVMTLMSRLLITFCEIWARSVSSCLDNELIENSHLKDKIVDSHIKRSFSIKKSKMKMYGNGIRTDTLTNSDDASQWCQGFVMTAFATLSLRVEEHSGISDIICYALNQCTMKKIEINKELLSSFAELSKSENTSDFVSNMSDRELDRMYKEFSSDHMGNFIIEKGKCYMNNMSNMGQGQFHIFSSIMHAAAGLVFEDWATSRVSMSTKKATVGIVCSYYVTSDDSALIMTAWSRGEDDRLSEDDLKRGCVSGAVASWQTRSLLRSLARVKPVSMSLWCATSSYEKSTAEVFNGVMEFNSTWYIKNTIVPVTMKYFSASLNILSATSLAKRSMTAANMRTSLFKNGAKCDSIFVVQRCQELCHYRSLGSELNPLFPEFYENVKELGHPSLGYFTKSCKELCGIMGYRYTLYSSIREDKIKRATLRILQHVLGSNATNGKEENSLAQIRVTMGGFEKYKEFKDRIGATSGELSRRLLEKPEVLISYPESKEDMITKMYDKSLSPGASDSFRFMTKPFLRTMSYYLLHKPVVGYNSGDGKPMRYSLLRVTEIVKIQAMECLREEREINDKEMNIYFNSLSCFQLMETVVDTLGGNLIDTGFLKERFVKIPIPDNQGINTACSIRSAVLVSWFGKSLKGVSMSEASHTLREYSKHLPWLKVTLQETLASPDYPFTRNCLDPKEDTDDDSLEDLDEVHLVYRELTEAAKLKAQSLNVSCDAWPRVVPLMRFMSTLTKKKVSIQATGPVSIKGSYFETFQNLVSRSQSVNHRKEIGSGMNPEEKKNMKTSLNSAYIRTVESIASCQESLYRYLGLPQEIKTDSDIRRILKHYGSKLEVGDLETHIGFLRHNSRKLACLVSMVMEEDELKGKRMKLSSLVSRTGNNSFSGYLGNPNFTTKDTVSRTFVYFISRLVVRCTVVNTVATQIEYNDEKLFRIHKEDLRRSLLSAGLKQSNNEVVIGLRARQMLFSLTGVRTIQEGHMGGFGIPSQCSSSLDVDTLVNTVKVGLGRNGYAIDCLVDGFFSSTGEFSRILRFEPRPFDGLSHLPEIKFENSIKRKWMENLPFSLEDIRELCQKSMAWTRAQVKGRIEGVKRTKLVGTVDELNGIKKEEEEKRHMEDLEDEAEVGTFVDDMFFNVDIDKEYSAEDISMLSTLLNIGEGDSLEEAFSNKEIFLRNWEDETDPDEDEIAGLYDLMMGDIGDFCNGFDIDGEEGFLEDLGDKESRTKFFKGSYKIINFCFDALLREVMRIEAVYIHEYLHEEPDKQGSSTGTVDVIRNIILSKTSEAIQSCTYMMESKKDIVKKYNRSKKM